MPSLQEIKNRLSSVSTTKKITKAMQLVATSKIQKAKKNLESIQEYYTSVYDMFQDLISNVKNVQKLFPLNPKVSTLHILITSDMGLCGGYNSNVLKILKNEFSKNDNVIVLGNKGVNSVKSFGMKTILEFPSIGDEPHYVVASEISKLAIAKFESGEINKVKLIYTKFINSVTYDPISIQLLPIEKSKEDNKTTSKRIHSVTEFEPSAEVVLKRAFPLYISSLIFGAMVESKVSEMSSRRTAMENATDNAEELTTLLNLEYNRIRQSAITQEISEIVAGSET